MTEPVNPVVSVVLPVYNCARYVGLAVESILAQTYADFELLVVDDGSSDETPTVLGEFADKRLLVVRQPNRGVAAARNRGIALSRGRYIAQMDADDLSNPGRIARQVAFLDDHPRCGMVGTWAEIWSGDEKTQRVHAHPVDNGHLKFELLFDNPFVQSSVMIRREVLDEVGPYTVDPARQPPEDFELWSRVARCYDVANIGEVLQIYREVEGSLSRQGSTPFRDHLVTLSAENIGWAAGVGGTDTQVVNIAALVHGASDRVQGEPDFAAMRQVLRRAAARVTDDPSEGYEREADRRIGLLYGRRWANPDVNRWTRWPIRPLLHIRSALRTRR